MFTRELRGVIRGKLIELEENPGWGDGDPVKVTIRLDSPPGECIRRAAGSWANGGQELDNWLEGVYRDRDHDRDGLELD